MSRGTQHGWSKLAGPVGNHVQNEAGAGSEAAKGVTVRNV